MNKEQFKKDLENIINRHCIENGSNTPDWMLADYLMGCLETYEAAVNAREKWYGRAPTIVSPPISSPDPFQLTSVVGLVP